MKKYSIYLLLAVLSFFLIPAVLINKGEKKVSSPVEENKVEEINFKYDYGKYKTIKLLHKDTNKIEEIKLDEYIKNVVSAEMPANFEKEALKAQAIVARTYTIYRIENSKKHEEADICDKADCCQAWISKDDRINKWDEDKRTEYWNKIEKAVYETEGKIITYNGKVINAFFHSNSGGKTEIPVYVWGGDNYPYLKVVETSGEENYIQYKSEVEFTKNQFIEKIKEKHPDFEINFEDIDCIKIVNINDSNRITSIKIGNLTLSGVEVRSLLGLKSTNFTFEITDEIIKFTVIGYGHGVGMSQTGANSLAKEGKTAEEIIKHFYQNVEIVNL